MLRGDAVASKRRWRYNGVVRGCAAVMPPQMGCHDCGLGVLSRERAVRGWDAPGESPRRRLLVEMTTTP